MCISLVVLCLFKKCQSSMFIMLDRLKYSLNRFTKVYGLRWINSHLHWIDSWMSRLFFVWHKTLWLALIMGSLQSIQICIESFHNSCFSGLFFCCLNRFKHLVNRFTLLFLCENWVFSSFTLYTLFFTTSRLLNHLRLFSLGLKNSLFIHSLRLNIFS
jgi:hypothetical protein